MNDSSAPQRKTELYSLLAALPLLLILAASLWSRDPPVTSDLPSDARFYYYGGDADVTRDPPRLTILAQREVDGKEEVSFRLTAPARREVSTACILVYADGEGWETALEGSTRLPIELRPGQSADFSVQAPTQSVWTLRISLQRDRQRTWSEWMKTLEWSWRSRSLHAAQWVASAGLLESRPITNRVVARP